MAHAEGTPGTPRRKITPWWPLYAAIAGVVLVVAACCGGGFVGLMVIGYQSPDTRVLPGLEVSTSYVRRMENLGMLQPNGTIYFFYSDGLLNLEEGAYVLTDEGLVLYCRDWNPPLSIVPYDAIAETELLRDTSFFTDSTIIVETKGEWYVEFPVSSERDGDVRFHDALRKNAGLPPIQ